MTKVRTTENGFPGGCPLPDGLSEAVLAHTNSQTRRACKVCMDMGDKTKQNRQGCPWSLGVGRFVGRQD